MDGRARADVFWSGEVPQTVRTALFDPFDSSQTFDDGFLRDESFHNENDARRFAEQFTRGTPFEVDVWVFENGRQRLVAWYRDGVSTDDPSPRSL